MFVNAPASVQRIPSKPHSFITTSRNTGLAVIGTPFHALYEAIMAFAPPSRIAIRNGTA